MIKALFITILLFCTALNGETNPTSYQPPLIINLISANRSGLAKDRDILKAALETLGCHVNWYDSDRPVHAGYSDINIFCERLIPSCFDKARLNWFVPNPEWFIDDLNLLNSIDLILCRTHEVERIFQSYQMNTYYCGFTSPDHLDETIPKDYKKLLHTAGTSWQKGTVPLYRTWRKHPEFPLLTIIRFEDPYRPPPKNVKWITDWLPESQFKAFQNSAGIHICLSETEGFGHALMESMSTGAVLVTTDAPPMNEFIRDPRCLVPYNTWRTVHLGTAYFVNTQSVAAKIEELLKLPESELKKIGKRNRRAYLQHQKKFYTRLSELIDQVRTLKQNHAL
jgi:glycosyltransferase involved in cell wall biosynthesis